MDTYVWIKHKGNHLFVCQWEWGDQGSLWFHLLKMFHFTWLFREDPPLSLCSLIHCPFLIPSDGGMASLALRTLWYLSGPCTLSYSMLLPMELCRLLRAVEDGMEYEVFFFLIPHLLTAVSSHTVMRAAPIHICHKKSLNPSFVASPSACHWGDAISASPTTSLYT